MSSWCFIFSAAQYVVGTQPTESRGWAGFSLDPRHASCRAWPWRPQPFSTWTRWQAAYDHSSARCSLVYRCRQLPPGLFSDVSWGHNQNQVTGSLDLSELRHTESLAQCLENRPFIPTGTATTAVPGGTHWKASPAPLAQRQPPPLDVREAPSPGDSGLRCHKRTCKLLLPHVG